MSIKIVGTGSYLPERVLSNAELEKMVDTSDEWIRARTGIEERRIAAPGEFTSDMGLAAARRAIEAAGISPEEISVITVATSTPDYPFPNTGSILQHRLGATNAFCFDLAAACSGFIYSLEVAYSLLTAQKKYRYALVCGAEKLSCVINWKDRNTCVLFGDGAGAVVLCRDDEDDSPSGLVSSCLHTDGTYGATLRLPGGGSRHPASAATVPEGLHFIHMEGKETFKLAVNAMISSCRTVLQEAGVTADDVKLAITHQANRRIIDAVAQRIKIDPGKVFGNIAKYGNTSAASIAICIDEAVRVGRLDRGDLLLITAFGAGLTWGAQLIRY